MNNKLKFRLPVIEPEYVIQAMSEVYDWGLIDLQIPELHKKTLGNNVSICIVDSGRSEHFEVEHATADSMNFTDSRTDKDVFGHSTFVSGIISAQINNQGIIGVAPKAKIYYAKALDDAGSGNPAFMVKAIKWAIQKEVDIISISAGMFIDFKPLKEIVKEAYRNNIIIIAATGNTGSQYYNVAYPARYEETIGVAAYDKHRKVASFSSRGANVAFALPGVDIYSTWLDNQFCKNSGTSFATPLLSGICALILSKHKESGNESKTPCETPKQMLEHLKKYSIKLGDHNETGFGTIDTTSIFGDI